MKFTVLVATTLTDDALATLRNARDIDLVICNPDPKQINKAIENADALIIRDEVVVDAALLSLGKRLRVIGRAGVGLAGIDVETATARGVIVMNTPGANAIAASEYTFALMLVLCRDVIPAHLDLIDPADVLKQQTRKRRTQLGVELYGKTLGLIGLGRVGRHVAERAIAFGMEVLAYDPYVSETQVNELRVKLVGLDEVIVRSDIISLHCAVSPETFQILDEEALSQVKAGVRIINTAHGSMIDEAALVKALKAGQVAGAAVDMYAEVPPKKDSPLMGLPNVVHTLHAGDATIEAQHVLSLQIVEQVCDALRGVDYRNAVNMPFMPGRAFEAIAPYMHLAERIGALQHYLARGRIRRVAVEYKGDELAGLVKPLTVALLKGMLEPVLGNTVNYINAPLVAMEHGMHVTQTKGLDVADYLNLVSCQVHWEGGGELVISGALFSHQEPRIVQIDTYRSDFRPEGVLLVFGSYDVPGVIGKVGTLMAQHNINIAAWRTGRAQKGGQTLTVLTLDQSLSDTLLEEFRQQDFVRHATQLVLP